MAIAGVRELRNRLTEYLRRTKRGEEIVVTDRGQPIAVIRPIGRFPRSRARETRLARLASQGLIALPTRKPLKRVRAIEISGRPISGTIVEDRR
jgi:prevent-host-death family protein